MNDENRRISELATSMYGYLAEVEEDFPANSVGGRLRNELGEQKVKIDQFGSQQSQERNAAKAQTDRKSAFEEEIKRRMKEMRRTSISGESEQPGISQHFNLPTSKSEESLIEAARAFIASGTDFKPFFLSREMPENFLNGLEVAIGGFEGAVDEYNTHARNAKAATAMLEDVCARVLEIRRELDPIVRNKYRNDPEKLARWEAASRLERPARRAASKDSNGEPTNSNGGPTNSNGGQTNGQT
ncbi:MAG TPA: hypothetical protein VNZ44_10730 [Pyrinomonadaceae bacterium]|nr:hypothetical protein [Pyrinomonadaceae bacterium]